ncbi:DUF2243 domain-containing protein [Tabrizicola sp.]|uniref:DUF2243 domain-containing protein n=1 Tax=Tabrizicola sp. TaxID=2005166 RepID=UPI00273401EC|nr:DUF2243 domain-containing protein [Tabrizicola sp.]MDP3197550.1 DUF2243 domain-containing protein [Tabrizicola sp.]
MPAEPALLSTQTVPTTPSPPAPFPTRAALLLGTGLGGFVDGIVLHQILQWDHSASSAGVPVDTVEGLKLNTFLDGLFHVATWIMTVAGIALVWRGARRGVRSVRGKLVGGVLMGFGLFNLVEGLVNHQLLGLHHVKETAPPDRWLAWDPRLLASGLLLLGLGCVISRKAPA